VLHGQPVVVHVSNAMPGGLWLIEVRQPSAGSTEPLAVQEAADVTLLGGGTVHLLAPFTGSNRLWLATIGTGTAADVLALLERDGRPIRYRYVPEDWPLSAYQTAFSLQPGSAEMPSAARPFTPAVVTDLVRHGVAVAPLLLHTGVSSLEGGEAPYPERFAVPTATAERINSTRAAGGHVIAVGTTVVRALETVIDEHGTVHPGRGWTDVVVTPDRPARSVDGLLTGWHEPAATHLLMLEAIASPTALAAAYREAFAEGYLWHEFGDSHLILPYRQ
jgi:S-adenosylmethionine:tRNA ribosyltransferase-isomerase